MTKLNMSTETAKPVMTPAPAGDPVKTTPPAAAPAETVAPGK